jgi:uncharacterized protein (TIGR02569 family)
MAATGTHEPPPAHVRAAFGAVAGEGEALAEGAAWRYGTVVLEPVTDRAQAVWLARTLGGLDVSGLRVGRMLRATDGRWLVGGWRARRHISGRREYRPDETVQAAVTLHRAVRHLPRPDVRGRSDVHVTADRLAWGEHEARLDENRGGRWFEVLAGSRRPIWAPEQLVHGELFGSLLFDGTASPGIVDFIPYYRPAEWGAAVVAVDAVASGHADGELLRRWSHLPHWSQMLLRAVLFRLAAHALDPNSPRRALDGLHAAAHEVSEVLR